MQSIAQPLPGVHVLQPKVFKDHRGEFVKTYHREIFAGLGLQLDLHEEFFSTSARGVIRGMHFQLPPHDHAKLVYCVQGKVLDVLVDLRKSSATYGKSCSFELSRENRHQVFIPRGFAHGFLTLEQDSVMVYKTDAVYAAAHDTGIRWDSFGFDWPDIGGTIISDRDRGFSTLAAFASPF